MIENEYKYLVSKNALEESMNIIRQNELFLNEQCIHQKNYYYDNENFDLLHHGVTLRIREINEKYEIHCKKQTLKMDELRVCEEKMQSIDHLPKFLSDLSFILPVEGPFLQLGCLETIRNHFILSEGVCVDFDENHYHDIVDYEVEIEFENRNPAEIVKIIRSNSLSSSPISKYNRFINRYKEIYVNG